MEKLPSQPEQRGIVKKLKQAVTGAGIMAASFLPMQEQQASSGETAQAKEVTKDMVQEINPADYIKKEGAVFPTFEEFTNRDEVKQEIASEKAEIPILNKLIKERQEKIASYKALLSTDPERYSRLIAFEKNELEYCQSLLASHARDIRDGGRTKYKQLLTEIDSAYNQYDEQLHWMKRNITSPEYRERLKKEFPDYGDEYIDGTIENRLRMLNDGYNLVEGRQVSETAEANYSLIGNKINLPTRPSDGTTGIHEFTHATDASGIFMSPKAANLYKESFAEDDGSFPEEQRLYHLNPTERNARKKALEYEMEKYHIKRYDETFTDKHYVRLMELLRAGKLSNDSKQFLQMTTPEYMKEIMNTIADNSDSKKDNNPHVDSMDFPLQA